ncbi:MAG: hypothetical protein ACK4OP_16185 [Gemmobacter sp.]
MSPAPFHKAGINPTLPLEGDPDPMRRLERCGDDAARIGAHHPAGSAIIARVGIFIAAAAERAPHIRVGTGLTSLSCTIHPGRSGGSCSATTDAVRGDALHEAGGRCRPMRR